MNYLKYTPYIYLVFAIYFIYEGVMKWNESENKPWLHFVIAGMAIFMFFFRRKFAKKINDQNKKS
ncbi:hypothetical protein [Flavobacterium ovatum]|uniref:hypothetical protein n=1 Tax=Flavobacterium ovatum TaxID=1928857 RepID=UPI00344BD657